MAEPDHHPVIQGFLNWVRRAQVCEVLEPTGERRRAFIPIQKLQTYFTERERQSLVEILAAVFGPEEPPVYAENIVPKYTAVFSILVHINKGRYINEFTQHAALSDSRLPFDPQDRPPKFPISPHDPNFFSRFCDEQWKFCAPPFQRHMLNEQFEEKRILPIIYKDRLGGGGSGTLYKIKIHKHYNQLLLDESKAKLNEESATTFVLKTYITEEARKYYDNEVAAFKRLRPTPNIIEFYGSYIHGDKFNVILEFADKGTLERYFREEPEPRTGEDILKFWRSLLMLGQALTGIHEVEPVTSTDGPPIFQGWHQDIKPENILIISDNTRSRYEWQFKLGDLGLSHFNNKVASSGEPTATDAHGTRTYGAPECYRANNWDEQSNMRIKQNVDIWSLGCVYSEAARWVTGGYNGLEEYRLERKAETDSIRHFRDGDCFHNGEKALRAVAKSHKKARDSLGRKDYITEKVIETLVKDMLSVTRGRPTASGVWIKSERILEEAQEMLDEAIDTTPAVRGLTNPLNRGPPLPPQLPPSKLRGSRGHSLGRDAESGHLIEADYERYAQVLDGDQTHSPDSASEKSYDHTSPSLNTRDMRGELTARPPKKQHSSDSQVPYGGTGRSFTGDDQATHNPINGRLKAGSMPSGQRASSKSVSFDDYKDRSSAADIQNGTIGGGIARTATGSIIGRSQKSILGKDRAATPEEASSDTGDGQNLHKFKESPLSIPQRNPPNSGEAERYGLKDFPPTISSSQPSLPQSSVSPENEPPYEGEMQQTAPEPGQAKGIASESLPFLTVKDALKWKEKKKSGLAPHLEDSDLIGRLDKRDHMFLIDDSKSMEPYWKEVKMVLEALSYIVKDCDPDGTELYYTISKDHKKDKNTSGLLAMVKQKSLNGVTDIDLRLNEILEKYKAKLEAKPSLRRSLLNMTKKEPKGVRPLSIYVLTNGMWELRSTGETPIINLVHALLRLDKTKSQIGIQFISFGNSFTGLQKMKWLDSGIGRHRKKGEWLDIVDTIPSTGSVWKMLLGGINPTYDDDEDLIDDNDHSKKTNNNGGATGLASYTSQQKKDDL